MTMLERDEDGQERGAEDDGDCVQAARTHISAAGLRARGWTAGMVRRLLGEPDLLRVNPHFRSAPKIRLYLVERVAAAERSEEFRTVAAAAARRSASATAAAQRRRQVVLARIAAEPVDGADCTVEIQMPYPGDDPDDRQVGRPPHEEPP
ncbi:hypothetical protein [Streptomyces sp. GESEQ-35]|uniref:hypothetical protein n=1 Tax=Streptomyces sp. GESEQ-35 TaxID=2812657 RepID=UPI001B337427|nr:hypothetical protein [Streptomyces sp. GESEQ-35]